MKWFNYLYRESLKHEHPKTVVVCCITRGGRILGTGFNKFKGPNSFGRHAEIDCLNRVTDGYGATAWILRRRADGSVGIAKPCKKCEAALREAGIKRVRYTETMKIEYGEEKYA